MRAYVSNQIEELLELLLEELMAFGKATILVPSQAMKGWLEHALSHKRAQGTLGIKIATSSIQSEHALKVFLHTPSKKDLYRSLAHSVYGIEVAPGSEPYASDIVPKDGSYLFLFGWSSLCPAYIASLKDAENCTLLIFSPCMLFWSDVLSQSEESFLMRRLDRLHLSLPVRDRLEELLADKNPFLANTGVLSRTLQENLEDVGIICTERYVLQDSIINILPYKDLIREEALVKSAASNESQPSFLERVQADMLMLISERERIDLAASDKSIQIIETATRTAEIEACRSSIEKLFQGRDVHPGSVYILAPHIKDYKGAIGRVFGVQDPQIPYQIIDEWSFEHDPIVKQFFICLQISTMRLDFDQLKELLGCKAIQLALKISKDDALTILGCLKRTGFRFGLHKTHAKTVLELEGFCLRTTNIGHTLSDILQSLWSDGIFNEETDLLARLVYFLETLQAKTVAFESGPDCLLKICRDIFAFAFADDGSKSYEELWKLLLVDAQYDQKPISYDHFIQILKEVVRIHFETRTHHHIWAPIVCASLKGTPPPAQVVAILGQELGPFPNEEIDLQWNYLDQYSKKTSFDSALLGRKAFLEAVFAAREQLIITHRNYSFERRSKIQPSILLSEFSSSIAKRYGEKVLETCTTVWPFEFSTVRKAIDRSAPILKESLQETDCGKVVDILVEDLLRFGKNPVLDSLKRRFGLKFQWEEFDDLLLPKQTVIQEIRTELEAKSHTVKVNCTGFLRDLYVQELEHMGSLTRKSLKPTDLPISVMLSSSAQTSSRDEAIVTVPSFINSNKTHRLLGQAPILLQSAQLLFSSDFTAEKIRRWPEVLLRAYIQKKSELPIELRLVSVLNQDEQTLDGLDCENGLEAWIDYYKQSMSRYIPLNEKIVGDLFKNKLTRETLIEHLQDLGPFTVSDAVKEYVLDNAQSISLDELQCWAERLYSGAQA